MADVNRAVPGETRRERIARAEREATKGVGTRKRPTSTARAPRKGTTAAEAMKTRRMTQGVPTFGAPISRMRQGQSTDSNN